MTFRKSITEPDLLAFLKEDLHFPPFQVQDYSTDETWASNNILQQMDALLILRWRDRDYHFGVEARRLWTPKIIAEAIDTVQRHLFLGDEGIMGPKAGEPLYPLVLVPYLSEDWLLKLEAKGVSGLDLCGNGVVVVPGELLVLRTGFPNRYPWEGTIKNVYRKNSSTVARVFLLVPQYRSVKESLEEIRKRGGDVTLATVSKVCKSLENDVVIKRFRRKPAPRQQGESRRLESFLEPALRLLQPEKLLNLLADNYALPAVTRTFKGKSKLRPDELRLRLAGWEDRSGGRIVLTGASSTQLYAVMEQEQVQSFYCSDLDSVFESLGDDIREVDWYPNVRFLETKDDFVYFDRRPNLVASPIQSYMELVNGDKRQQETAEQVRRVILGPLAQDPQEG